MVGVYVSNEQADCNVEDLRGMVIYIAGLKMKRKLKWSLVMVSERLRRVTPGSPLATFQIPTQILLPERNGTR
ncbi:hypothetical protein cypCar_00038582 [Cyprinus carpio]|nr:hypothetical protein cypCar_00038582 [Cyprinus carpio]